MTSYPGEEPRPEQEGVPAGDEDQSSTADEPTAPITPSAPVFNPAPARFEGSGPTAPYGASYPGSPYGPASPPAQPAPVPASPPPPPYVPPPPALPPGYYPPALQPYGGFTPPPPDHPQSTLSLVLGLVGMIGGLSFCGVGFIASPFAWALGHNALREIQASQGRLGGAGVARAGMILGIVGTVILGIAVVGLILFTIVAVAGASSAGSV